MMFVSSTVFLPHASQVFASTHHSTLQIAHLVAQKQHHSTLPTWLTHLGSFGLFAVAIVDSSVIPLPVPGSTDLLLLWLIAHSGSPWLLVPIAVVGSLVGSFTTWQIGHRGGEAA